MCLEYRVFVIFFYRKREDLVVKGLGFLSLDKRQLRL